MMVSGVVGASLDRPADRECTGLGLLVCKETSGVPATKTSRTPELCPKKMNPCRTVLHRLVSAFT